MDLRIRYFSPDRKLGGLLKPFKVLHRCIRSFPSLIRMSFSKKLSRSLFCAGCLDTTIQEDHPGVVSFPPLCSTTPPEIEFRYQLDNTLAEIAPSNNRNNSSAIHARYSNLIGIYSIPLMLHSGSNFHHANNTAVHGGTFYAAQSLINLIIRPVQGENSP